MVDASRNCCVSWLPDFFGTIYQNGIEKIPNERNITEWPYNVLNGHKIEIKRPIFFTLRPSQIGIFDMKMYDLATLS
jgi:hypothetical protein